MVKNRHANARDALGSIPRSGRSPGGGHHNPLQYSCPENLRDREAWQAIWDHKASDMKDSTSLSREHLLHPLDAGLPPSLTGGMSNISVFTILLTGHMENCFVVSVERGT